MCMHSSDREAREGWRVKIRVHSSAKREMRYSTLAHTSNECAIFTYTLSSVFIHVIRMEFISLWDNFKIRSKMFIIDEKIRIFSFSIVRLLCLLCFLLLYFDARDLYVRKSEYFHSVIVWWSPCHHRSAPHIPQSTSHSLISVFLWWCLVGTHIVHKAHLAYISLIRNCQLTSVCDGHIHSHFFHRRSSSSLLFIFFSIHLPLFSILSLCVNCSSWCLPISVWKCHRKCKHSKATYMKEMEKHANFLLSFGIVHSSGIDIKCKNDDDHRHLEMGRVYALNS